MFLAKFALFISSDASSLPSMKSMQAYHMQLFFDGNRDFTKVVSFGKFNSDVCGDDENLNWRGIKCEHAMVTEISYINEHNTRFKLEYIPPTARIVDLRKNGIHCTLMTRLLPRALEFLNLDRNRIFGICNLSTLPESLKTLTLSFNQISDVICLNFLPKSLEKLDITHNRIEKRVVHIGKLPDTLRCIALNGNMAVEALEPLPGTCIDNERFLKFGLSIFLKDDLMEEPIRLKPLEP